MPGRILIADPISSRRIHLGAVLTNDGYEVLHADNGTDALTQHGTTPADIVLLSTDLSDAPLQNQCSAYRKHARNRSPVIVSLVPDSAPDDRLACLENGADEVIEREELSGILPRLRSLMRRRQRDEAFNLRCATNRTLGLSEAAMPFETPSNVTIVSCGDPHIAHLLSDKLVDPRRKIRVTEPELLHRNRDTVTDVFLLVEDGAPNALRDLIGTIRVHRAVTPPALICMADTRPSRNQNSPLDMDADDLIPRTASIAEIGLRIDRHTRRKRETDRLEGSLQRMAVSAYSDHVTGLRNRNYAEEYLRKLDRQLAENPSHIGLLIADVDHFKSVNDEHGHLVGDTALYHIGKTLRANLRDADMIARYGGEEFLIILTDLHVAAAKVVAQRLRKAVAETALPLPSGMPLNNTISIGAALATRSSPRSTRELIRAADLALYRAKSNGRNRIELATAADFEPPPRHVAL